MRSPGVAGASPSTFVLVLAVLSLAAALSYPTLQGRAFRTLVETAIADVDAVAYVARSSLASTRTWPPTADPGRVPEQMASLSGPDGPFSRESYTLGWTAWDVVDSVEVTPEVDPVPTPGTPLAPGDAPPPTEVEPYMTPVPRQMGSIVVYSGDASLLAELLQHYGPEVSFVIDTAWVLLLPQHAALPGEAGVSFLGR